MTKHTTIVANAGSVLKFVDWLLLQNEKGQKPNKRTMLNGFASKVSGKKSEWSELLSKRLFLGENVNEEALFPFGRPYSKSDPRRPCINSSTAVKFQGAEITHVEIQALRVIFDVLNDPDANFSESEVEDAKYTLVSERIVAGGRDALSDEFSNFYSRRCLHVLVGYDQIRACQLILEVWAEWRIPRSQKQERLEQVQSLFDQLGWKPQM